jgi:phage tail-like protein
VRRDDWLLAQLPVGMVEDDFFVRFVSIFQELAGSIMDGADNLENVIDVTVAPEPMVRWLASWIGVDAVDASLPGPLQRKIVQASARMLAWRGTRHGLQQFLELVSGGPAEIDDSGGVFAEGTAPDGPPRVRMRVGSTGWLPEADFVTLVRDEVPAHVEVELWVGERQLLPAASLLPEQRADVESADSQSADSQWARPVPEQRAEQADPSQPGPGAAPKNGEVEP